MKLSCSSLAAAALIWSAAGPVLCRPVLAQDSVSYSSPYSVKVAFPHSELIGDLESGARGRPELAAEIPFAEWYTARSRARFGGWGPHARALDEPQLAGRSVDWKRSRVLLTALRFRGYGYQHHHLPDWNPPAGWPWKETSVGHNGRGVDCSNFVSYAYDLALGLSLHSDVHQLAEQLVFPRHGKHADVTALRIERPDSYAALVRELRTGDLLFIRNKSGAISHVVMWVGDRGVSPDGTPLVLDSHGESVKDANGATIPAGIQLRPFRENSWYFKSASHALRLIQ